MTTNTSNTTYVRQGFSAVRPYLYGPTDLPTFIQTVFSSTELDRTSAPYGAHVEIQIGDSILIVEAMHSPENHPRSSLLIYVPNVDQTYQRAIQFGASSVAVPTDKPYQERIAGFTDTFGNIWWISTYQP